MECYEWILIIKQYTIYHRAADIFWCGPSGEKISRATALPSYDCRMQLTSHSTWDHIVFHLCSRTILVAKRSNSLRQEGILWRHLGWYCPKNLALGYLVSYLNQKSNTAYFEQCQAVIKIASLIYFFWHYCYESSLPPLTFTSHRL